MQHKNFQVLRAVIVHISLFWVVTPCLPLGGVWR